MQELLNYLIERRGMMDKKAVKEWAAEYKLINEMEREELEARLATETIEESIQSYVPVGNLSCRLYRCAS